MLRNVKLCNACYTFMIESDKLLNHATGDEYYQYLYEHFCDDCAIQLKVAVTESYGKRASYRP